ncbi:concanavalin A-like lectin/glucanase domain-containing protein [Paraphysoderma sedebokerense]|nr:concanavalin A-like lectin/glucanase domain-containing protein [Paraphysoderma sedebokerense]
MGRVPFFTVSSVVCLLCALYRATAQISLHTATNYTFNNDGVLVNWKLTVSSVEDIPNRLWDIIAITNPESSCPFNSSSSSVLLSSLPAETFKKGYGTLGLKLPTLTFSAGTNLTVSYFYRSPVGNITCNNSSYFVNATSSFTVYSFGQELGGGGWALRFTQKKRYENKEQDMAIVGTQDTGTDEFLQYAIYEAKMEDDRLFDGVEEITVEMWFRPSLKREHGYPDKGCCWGLFSTKTADTVPENDRKNLQLYIGDANALIFRIDSFGNAECREYYQDSEATKGMFSFINDNSTNWYHVAAVYDKSTMSKRTYLNGQLVVNSTCSGQFKLNANKFLIGYTWSTGAGSGNLEGDIDEVRIFRYSRTESQIRNSMFRRLTPFERHNMLAYYPVDSYQSNSPFLLEDEGPNRYNIPLGLPELNKKSTLVSSPSFIASDAPISGGPVVIDTVTNPNPALHNNNRSFILPTITNLTDAYQYKIIDIGMKYSSIMVDQNNLTVNQVLLNGSKVQMIPLAKNSSDWRSNSLESIVRDTMVYQAIVNSTTFSIPIYVHLDIKQNRPPVVGFAGKALYCDGFDDHLYAKDFSFENWTHTGPYTLEFYLNPVPNPRGHGTLYSFGNYEVSGRWCEDNARNADGSNSTTTHPWCIGRFLGHFPAASDELEAFFGWEWDGDGNELGGRISGNWASPFKGVWQHYAIVADGAPASGVISFYRNGALIGQYNNTGLQINSTVRGLHLCHWPFYGGTYHRYKGFIDEFRIWNTNRSQSDIQSSMNQRLSGSEPHLMAYYNFDKGFVDSLGATVIPDESGQNFTLGPYCNPETNCFTNLCLTDPKKEPSWHCIGNGYTSDPVTTSPKLVNSNAPIEELSAIFTIDVDKNITVKLNATDPDTNYVYLSYWIIQLPDRGRLYDILRGNTLLSINHTTALPYKLFSPRVLYAPNPGEGGLNYSQFKYAVSDLYTFSDNFLTVSFTVQCAPGTFADLTTKSCVSCPPGQYTLQNESVFGSCRVCPRNTYQILEGQTSCLECPKNEFQDTPGSTKCKRCSETPNAPSPPCVNSCKRGFRKTQNSDGVDTCVECSNGYNFNGTGVCYPCPEGTTCYKDVVVTKSNFWIDPYSLTNYSISPIVYSCPIKSCDANNTCKPHFTGPLCGQCETGYYLWHEECVACDSGSNQVLWSLLGIGAIIVVIVVIMSDISSQSQSVGALVRLSFPSFRMKASD